MKIVRKQFQKSLVATCVIVASCLAQGGQYTGNAPTCTYQTTNGTTCRIDMLDFMKTNYNYSGYIFNFANAFDATANSFQTQDTSATYTPSSNSWSYIYNNPVRAGFVQHPYVSNALVYSAGTSATQASEYFLYDGTLDNTIYVMSQPAVNGTDWFMSFTTTNASQASSSWQDRGYLWTAKRFDVTSAGSGVWTAANVTAPVAAYYNFNTSNVQDGVRLDKYNPQSSSTGAVKTITSLTYWNNTSDSSIINEFGGQLPTPMEVVALTYSVVDNSGITRMAETYYYARQALGGGSYNNFGLIKWRHRSYDTTVCTSSGLPTSGHSNAICDSAYPSMYVDQEDTYAKFASVNNANWWTQMFASKWLNDVKFTARSTTDSYGNIAETNARPRNRGGFLPQGAGNDSSGTPFGSSNWIYMESDGADEDYYLYVNGTDPLYAPNASPTNYCRDGYAFVGSLVTMQSYNELQWGGGTEGDWAVSASGSVGTVYPSSPQAHWIVVCASAKPSSSPNLYVNASNSGEASCTTGYSPRLWFNSNHSGVTACPAGGSCFDGSSKGFINFCVKSTECVGSCGSTSNP